ncbi:hypothetical protein [Algoriphagus confluentis]|uniref:hypothetical protein n=1 Tax=Algoriphagus confluentis TaxID=1697556 RepID=UPI0030C6B4D9
MKRKSSIPTHSIDREDLQKVFEPVMFWPNSSNRRSTPACIGQACLVQTGQETLISSSPFSGFKPACIGQV